MIESAYSELLEKKQLVRDPDQKKVVQAFQTLYDALDATSNSGNLTALSRVVRRWSKNSNRNRIKGLYIWGGVGRGKTFLMDLFFSNLHVQKKLRLHFHHFMDEVHNMLKTHRNRRDPLKIVAQKFTDKAGVLCLDEFFVNDIGDAMILSGLLTGLFANGVTLITTSNVEPDSLYKNGLQRKRFLPAIKLLREQTNVVKLGGKTDHRFEFLQTSDVYNSPVDASSEDWLEHNFLNLATQGNEASWEKIKINDRYLRTIRHTDRIVWFDFKEICDGPRSTSDYIGLANQFNTILISHVPVFKGKDDQARRFINLIDELYDRNVKLILSAEAEPNELYQGLRLQDEFKRTASRLIEMQSHQYLEKQHRPNYNRQSQ